jgi:hypothetical protein
VRYRGFGVVVESEVPLPMAPAEEEPAVHVRRAPALERPNGEYRYLRTAADRPAVRWTSGVEGETVSYWFEDAGVLRVSGEEPVIEVDEQGSAHRMVRYLMATGLSCLLSRMGRLVLHGGSVAGERGAMAVCGPSGRGKTTSVLGLAVHGWPVLHDDLTVLTPTWMVHPGPSRALALADAAAALGCTGAADPDGHVVVDVDGAPASSLQAVLLLEKRGADRLERLPSPAAAVRIGQETGWWSLLGPEARRTRFDLIAGLAEDVPCYAWSPKFGVEAATAALVSVATDLVGPPLEPEARAV